MLWKNTFLIILGVFFCFSSLYAQENTEDKLLKKVESLENKIDELQTKVLDLEQNKETTLPKDTEGENIEDKYTKLQQRVDELEKQDDGFSISWKNGIKFDTDDKQFSLGFGGRAFLDFGFVNEDDAVQDQLDEINDFTQFRAARLKAYGTIYERYVFKAEFDFSDGVVDFKDVFMGVKKLPFNGTIIAGFFKEPFSVENITSARFITFLERGSITAFVPGRNIGVAYFGHDDDKLFTLGLGVFRDGSGDDPPDIQDDSGNYAFSMRMTCLPFYEDKGNKLLHLGFSSSFRNPLNDEVRFRARPEIGVGPRFVDTGAIADTEFVYIAGADAAFVYEKFSIQAETILTWVDRKELDTEMFWGYYIYFSYFLTENNRNYKTSKGAFNRISPEANFLTEDGWGDFEFAIRYSKLDLNDDNIRGRRLDDVTIGLNWYLNPNMRITANYIYSIINNLNNSALTDTHIFALRFQVDW